MNFQNKLLESSERIKFIRDRKDLYHDRSQVPLRDESFYKSFERHSNEINAIKFAYGFSEYLDEKRILLQEYDILAGFPFRYCFESTSSISGSRDYDPTVRSPIWPDVMKEANACIRFNNYEEDSETARLLLTFAHGTKNWLYKHYEWGHIIAGYERVLNMGFGGLINEGRNSLKKADKPESDFIYAMLITNEGAGRYIRRYGQLALEIATKASSSEYHKNMIRISDACEQIAYGPATNFFEAVQLLWFTHEMILMEMMAGSYSLGRMDKYLYPFYKKDIESGKITQEEAEDIIEALWIKFSAHVQAYQNVTLGGIDKTGKYIYNDLTKICLNATKRLRFDQPLISLRCHPSMPEEAWEDVFSLLKLGMGFPALFNDIACIKAKERVGVIYEDAVNYGIVGCVEPVAPGKEYAKTEVLRINWGKILEFMLHGGKSTQRKDIFQLFHPRSLTDIKSFDEFYNWYKEELSGFTRLAISAIDQIDKMDPWVYPTPFLSSTIQDCYKKGMDVTGGGAVYNNTALNAAGMANIADSLAAIKKLVFDEKKYTLNDFAEATWHNFEGYEALYHEVTSCCPKFGNDIDEVDKYVAELVELYSNLADEHKNPRGGRYQIGLYTVDNHYEMGIRTGALPDGRLAGVSLANAIAPVQSCDNNGPTAVMNSVLKTDLSVASNGMVLDLKFSPKFFSGDGHINALKVLIKVFFERGGMELQFNVVDKKTLIDAQNNPEKHKNLIVRVSGFSAYFIALKKEGQDEIIKRTQYEAV
jgi:formate C-acetyltransferase